MRSAFVKKYRKKEGSIELSTNQTSDSAKGCRLNLIDAYRGLVIILMVAYHYCYDKFIIFGKDIYFVARESSFIWQQFICWSFILISGFVFPFGRKHALRHGIVVNVCGLLVTLVTFIAMPDAPVIFGVLNCIGCCMLLMIPISALLKRIKISPYIILVVSFALFLFLYGIPTRFVGIMRHPLINIDPAVYNSCKLLMPFGFPWDGFWSSDYFSLIPWLFLYICGYALNGIVTACDKLKAPLSVNVPVLSAIGRRSLLIYLAHQPICFAISYLLYGK